MTPCPACNSNPRRGPGLNCNPCEAAAKRRRRAAKRAARDRVPKFARPLKANRYIITAAQNATPVHRAFFDVLKVAARELGAELVVIPLRYKNPTSLWSSKQDSEDWWDADTVPFLFNQRKRLNPNLVLAADIKTQPTASSPLSGFESLTGAESCVVGHPKMQFRAIPVPTGRYPKILSTTGACTLPNYTDTKAGKIGEFHHFLGGLIVEIVGKTFHLRQINADRSNGSFTDLDKHFTSDGVSKAPRARALVCGDLHVDVIDPEVDHATFGAGGIVRTLDPETIVVHDVKDGTATNPHEVGNPFIAEAKRRGARQDVRKEIQEVVDFLNERGAGREVVIVDSNHHVFLARWVIRTDWKSDLKNAPFYLETARYMLDTARMGPGGAEYADPFPYWVSKLGAKANIRCLGPDESFKVSGIECGMHGHRGPNGARGSLKNLSRLGTKVISGHSHTPGIEEGHYQVGTSTPRRLSYQRGPGASLNTHAVIYASGKRALLTIIDGSWRADP